MLRLNHKIIWLDWFFMITTYNTSDIENLSSSFYKATGVNLYIMDNNFNRLNNTAVSQSAKFCSIIGKTKIGRENCAICDEILLKEAKRTLKPVSHTCHAGLLDIAVPIILQDNHIIGYIILGQIKQSEEFVIRDSLKSYDKNTISNLQDLYTAMPLFDDEHINSIITLSTMLAKYLLMGDIIKPKRISSLEKIIYFIDDHLKENLSISDIANQTFISKSLLYNLFRTHFNCTVKEYINKKRITKAKHLLAFSDNRIESIAFEVGFTDPVYFSKLFKKETGLSPLQYRHSQETNN